MIIILICEVNKAQDFEVDIHVSFGILTDTTSFEEQLSNVDIFVSVLIFL